MLTIECNIAARVTAYLLPAVPIHHSHPPITGNTDSVCHCRSREIDLQSFPNASLFQMEHFRTYLLSGDGSVVSLQVFSELAAESITRWHSSAHELLANLFVQFSDLPRWRPINIQMLFCQGVSEPNILWQVCFLKRVKMNYIISSSSVRCCCCGEMFFFPYRSSCWMCSGEGF